MQIFTLHNMRIQMIVISTISAALVVLIAGCRRQLKDFSFSYSIESIHNYKQTISFESDRTYKIETHNYYMDNFARKKAPVILKGTMTDEEFKEMKKLMRNINFYKMKDAYGFESDDEVLGNILYHIYFSSKDKTKYISIKNTDIKELPKNYLHLVDFINTFVTTHKE